jgi:hypothetical protein
MKIVRFVKSLILFVASLPFNLFVGWPVVLLIRILWGRNLEVADGILRCEIRPESYPLGGKTDLSGRLYASSRWPSGFYLYNRAEAMARIEPIHSWGGTSLGHAQFFGPSRVTSRTVAHESHHTRQVEAFNLFGALMAAIFVAVGHPWIGGVVWTFAGGVLPLAGFAAAWLRSDSRGAYRGSPFEVGAYAVGDAEEHVHTLDMSGIK